MNAKSGDATFKFNLFHFLDDIKLDFLYIIHVANFLLEDHEAYLQFVFSEDIF